VGPLIGGFIAQTIGWRWDFWISLIAGVVLTASLELFNQETNPRVLIHWKVQRLQKELGRDDLKSCYGGSENMGRTKILLNGLIRPTKMLVLSPLVFFLSLYIAFVYGVLYLLFTTIPLVFEQTYGFTVGLTGLVYLAIGFGNMLGWGLITIYSDKTVVRLAKANNGEFEPEMRLATTIFFGFFLPITFFWYGWCTEYKTHWISPILSLIPFGFGIMGLFLPITTYLVDSYPMYAASALAANTVLRSLVGALLPLAGPSMYSSMGLGWGNSLLGFICVAMIPVPTLIYKYGGKLRKSQRFKL
jgi:MFS family permease